MSKFKPAEVFHPGDFIQEEMDARGWTHGDFAIKLGIVGTTLVEHLISGAQRVTPDIAKRLAEAFDQNARLWLNLQRAYDDAG